MQTFPDIVERDRRAAAEQAVRDQQAHKTNVELFTKMFLSLGADCIKVATSRHDAELAEAKALAAYRWEQLLGMEQQIQRDAAALQSRPRHRPSERADETLPDRTLEQRNKDWEQQTEHRATALALLREQTKRERAELESLVVVNKRR